ncbi:HPP family protein [Limimaricola cinnabarinus]|jgi:CBS domain-containing membrane protein|uniref:Prohead protease n=1 Tax=Limimaricola cinnabarinus TaxID=1125964 RepID=A0A2G1MHQ6_9RHOB|nr:HPP family protein [Limimaricola cinnabarinus]PHP28227.1 prohead protease [Limimaricola cinnabarinus]
MRAWHHLYPALPAFHGIEALRAGLGALLGIGLCALGVAVAARLGLSSLYLVAPLGATAVLVFCVPNSPLAQPWSAVVGNMAAALVALATVRVVPAPWSAALAVGAAISVMMLLRALHPPGGAVALLTALEPGPALEAGPLFALMPVGLATAALVLAAVLYNRATGRVYPFRQPETTEDPAPPLGLTEAQLGALLDRFNQSTNLGVVDLGRMLAAAQAEAARHRFDGTSCADIMTTGLITVRPDTPLPEAARLFRRHAIKSLPVVEEDMTLRGIVLQADLLDAVAAQGRPLVFGPRSPRRNVSQVMRPAARAVPQDMPVGALLHRLAAQGSEVIPVVHNERLVGILTRSDIIRLLLHGAGDRAAA